MSEQIIGITRLKRDIERLGKVPQKIVTFAVRKGARVVMREAKAKAPVEFGNLKRGIVLKGERSRKSGKKVYQVVFDKNMNDVFVKISKAGKRAYYPASQEYGFFARNGRYIPGYNFLRGSNARKQRETEEVIIKAAQQEVDKIL